MAQRAEGGTMAGADEKTVGAWEHARDEGIHLLEVRQLERAVERLTEAASGDPGGESEALLGLAHFLAERYAEAAVHYAKALETPTPDPEWRTMLAASEANATGEV